MTGIPRVIAIAAVLLIAAGWLRTRTPSSDLAPVTLDVAEVVTCDPDDQPSGRRMSSAVAAECPEQYDGTQVTMVGEVVGDVLVRSDGAWIQLNDDDYGLVHGPLASTGQASGASSGLAVWLPDELARGLVAGRAHQRGHLVEVTGTFHRADPRDGGGTTIRATDLIERRPPQRLPVRPDPLTLTVVGALVAIAAGTTLGPRRPERNPRSPR